MWPFLPSYRPDETSEVALGGPGSLMMNSEMVLEPQKSESSSGRSFEVSERSRDLRRPGPADRFHPRTDNGGKCRICELSLRGFCHGGCRRRSRGLGASLCCGDVDGAPTPAAPPCAVPAVTPPEGPSGPASAGGTLGRGRETGMLWSGGSHPAKYSFSHDDGREQTSSSMCDMVSCFRLSVL